MMGDLREALGGGNDIWKGAVAVAGLANGTASASDVRTDGTGSSGGIPGGHCETCAGSTAAQVAYVVGTVAPAIIGGVLSMGKKAAGVVAGEAGAFEDLVARRIVGDGLTPHHMPQAALGFTSRAEGGALVLPEAEHALTRTFAGRGARTAREEAGMAFRDVLARDIRDIRQLAGTKYDQGLRDLLQYYKTNFPSLMKR